MIYQLHTRSLRKYQGKYPRRINSWSYSSRRNTASEIIERHLGIAKPIHLELNDGTRFIAELKELNPDIRMGMEFTIACEGRVVLDLSVERYNAILAEIQKTRGTGMTDTADKIRAKRAMLRVLDTELNGLTGRFLSEEEQLRVRSIGDEQDSIEAELLAMEVQP